MISLANRFILDIAVRKEADFAEVLPLKYGLGLSIIEELQHALDLS